MSTKGLKAWNRGKRFPHTPEWEEHRLNAVRAAMKLMPSKKGVQRPRASVQPMLDAVANDRKKNPGKWNKIATKNLPKNVYGSNNGNWKGGITVKNRGVRWSNHARIWRQSVINRDGNACRLCKTVRHLQVHHIIPISKCPQIAWIPMNGVVLCKKCHYENDEAWQGKRFERNESIGKTLALIFTIPHKFQAYETCGNWQLTDSGVPVIFVSDMGDWRYELLVALHEFVEVSLCKHRGITTDVVDAFDIAFEKDREAGLHGDEDEPGDDPRAPYGNEHFFATAIEKLTAQQLSVNWSTYAKLVESLRQDKPTP